MTASPQKAAPLAAEAPAPNLFTREDTLLGVCQGLGEDFGVNPLWFRLAFIAPLFLFPAETIGAYLLIGFVLMVLRLTIPARIPAKTAVPVENTPAANDGDNLPIAA